MPHFNNNNHPQNNHNNNNQRRIPDNRADPMSNEQTKERYAQKIFRDIARREFNMFTDGLKVFNDEGFINAAIKVSQDSITKQNIIKYALEVAYPGAQDPMVIGIYNDCIKTINAYTIIINTLNVIKQTKDLNYLQNLVNQLPEYRHNL